jgi:hypothetical protein
MDMMRLVFGGSTLTVALIELSRGFVTPISLVTRRPARDCFAALAMTAPF